MITDTSAMIKGAPVQISLHHPFFGKPFVTKVVVLSPATSSASGK